MGNIVSAGYGFLCGAYMPISNFDIGLQKVLSYLPSTYGTSLLKNHMLRGIIEEMEKQNLPDTVISREYSDSWKKGDEPYYPVNDERNNALYEKYRELAAKEKNVLFGGRLGQYRYYDMDKVIAAALAMAEEEFNSNC